MSVREETSGSTIRRKARRMANTVAAPDKQETGRVAVGVDPSGSTIMRKTHRMANDGVDPSGSTVMRKVHRAAIGAAVNVQSSGSTDAYTQVDQDEKIQQLQWHDCTKSRASKETGCTCGDPQNRATVASCVETGNECKIHGHDGWGKCLDECCASGGPVTPPPTSPPTPPPTSPPTPPPTSPPTPPPTSPPTPPPTSPPSTPGPKPSQWHNCKEYHASVATGCSCGNPNDKQEWLPCQESGNECKIPGNDGWGKCSPECCGDVSPTHSPPTPNPPTPPPPTDPPNPTTPPPTTPPPTPPPPTPPTAKPPPGSGRPTWAEDVDSIVFDPDQGSIDALQRTCQFSSKRTAIFFTQSKNVFVKVGFYTAVYGTSLHPSSIQVQKLDVDDAENSGGIMVRFDTPRGSGSTHTFYRSAEGFTVEQTSNWATSQACALRRMHFKKDLHLSNPNIEHDWASGGFLASSKIEGTLDMGTQQQFLVRNTHVNQVLMSQRRGSWGGLIHGWNYVYVGSKGVPKDQTMVDGKPLVSTVLETPKVAEKPYVVYHNGGWHIAVPPVLDNSDSTHLHESVDAFSLIAMEDVFVAKPSHTDHCINEGIKGKKALLITPALYQVFNPVRIESSNFVVLGLGFATLLSMKGKSCIVVEDSAENVRLAGVMCDAMPDSPDSTHTDTTTEPLIHVKGRAAMLSDMFARVGTWRSDPLRKGTRSRADVMMHLAGNEIIADNLWLWYADHSTLRPTGCMLPESNELDAAGGPQSMEQVSLSDTALQVTGDDVITYCLMAEHTRTNIVHWSGERGSTYMFQSELPYSAKGGDTGVVLWTRHSHAYLVDDNVQAHHGVGFGAYPVSPCWGQPWWWKPTPATDVLFKVSAGTTLKLVLGWNNAQFECYMKNKYVNVLDKGGQLFGKNCQGCSKCKGYNQKHGFCYIKQA